MTEIGETVQRVDALIWDTKAFQKLCDTDIERAEEVVATGDSIADRIWSAQINTCWIFVFRFVFVFVVFVAVSLRQTGQQLISLRGACPKEVVQPKCDELSRVCDIVSDRLTRRLETLAKSRDLMERIEKVRTESEWGWKARWPRNFNAWKYALPCGVFVFFSRRQTTGVPEVSNYSHRSASKSARCRPIMPNRVCKRCSNSSCRPTNSATHPIIHASPEMCSKRVQRPKRRHSLRR